GVAAEHAAAQRAGALGRQPGLRVVVLLQRQQPGLQPAHVPPGPDPLLVLPAGPPVPAGLVVGADDAGDAVAALRGVLALHHEDALEALVAGGRVDPSRRPPEVV